jgi:hypothetical protein
MTDAPKMNLRQKLIEIYKRVDHVPKLGYNKKQNYYFVRAVDAMRAIRAAFAELGIYAETNYDLLGTYDIKTNSGGTMHTASVKATIRLYDTDSEETKTISGLGDGADSGDKGIFKAQTGATKNALRNGTLLPDEADPEADTRVDEAVDGPYPDAYSSQPEAQVARFDPETLQQVFKVKTPEPLSAAEMAGTAAGGQANVQFAGPKNPPSNAHFNPLPEPASAVQGDAYEEPEQGVPPTEEQLVAYRTKFRTLGDDLSAKGKLTSSRNLPITRKLLVFLLGITKAPDANSLSVAQWNDFFARAEAVTARENGLIDLAKMVNKANGIEPKEK